MFPPAASCCASRSPASRSWRVRLAPVLVRLGHGAQHGADAGGERRGEAGLAGAGRTVEQDADAALAPGQGRAQDRGGGLRLAAEMGEGVPGQRLVQGRPEELVAQVGSGADPAPDQRHDPVEHLDVAVRLDMEQPAREQPRLRQQPRLDLRREGADEQSDQPGVAVEAVLPVMALGDRVEQALDPAIQPVVQGEFSDSGLDRVEVERCRERPQPARGDAVLVAGRAGLGGPEQPADFAPGLRADAGA